MSAAMAASPSMASASAAKSRTQPLSSARRVTSTETAWDVPQRAQS